MSVPGLSAIDVTRIGNHGDMVTIGRDDAIAVDNTTTPPSVLLSGLALPALRTTSIFGDGVDGDVIVGTDTTLTDDMYYNNLTVNDGVALNTGSYRIFVKSTLSLLGSANINRNGTNGNNGGAAGGTFPPAPLAAATLGGGGGATGGVGGAPGGDGFAAGASAIATVLGGVGGNGGASQSRTGGAGSMAVPINSSGGIRLWTHDLQRAMYGAMIGASGIGALATGGRGGGGGAGSDAGGAGGSGAVGGGVVVIAARTISGTGTISAVGGAGGAGNSSGVGAGGGGGAGGGVILLVYNAAIGFSTTQLRVNGGAGGAGAGVGQNGTAGGSGRVYIHQV